MGQLEDQISEVVQRNIPFADGDEDKDGHDLPDGGVVTGWLLIAEWMGTDGQRWLSHATSDASGRSLPKWQVKGYATEMIDWDR